MKGRATRQHYGKRFCKPRSSSQENSILETTSLSLKTTGNGRAAAAAAKLKRLLSCMESSHSNYNNGTILVGFPLSTCVSITRLSASPILLSGGGGGGT